VWTQGNANVTKIVAGSLNSPTTVFATMTGDVYIDNEPKGRVDKWPMNANDGVPVMYFTGGWCSGLFVDIDNQLYCSIRDLHRVIKSSRTGDANISTIVAGTGLNGSTSDRLHAPHGIFLDIRFNLYVADCGNDRVQLFAAGQRNATTVAGNETRNPISLSCPTGVVLDGDGYLFIVDSGNNRIVGSGPDGFRCVVGCSRCCSSSSDHLCKPASMAFDTFGNIYVADGMNSRIQMFAQETKSCGEYESVRSAQISHRFRLGV
jgi:sugar lactone lactonase YvrE